MRTSSSLCYFLLVTFAITVSSSFLGENRGGLKKTHSDENNKEETNKLDENEEEESLIASQRDELYDMEDEIEELKDKLFMLYNPDKEGSNTEEEDLMVATSEDVVIISNALKNTQYGTMKFNSMSSSGTSKYPVDGRFHLLQGYSLTGPYASPFKPIHKKCIDGELVACEDNVASSDSKKKLSKTITSVKEMNSFTETVVGIEGSFMGGSGSGSVGVMANSRVNSKSVSHVIHTSLYSKVTNVRNMSELKLNEVAKRLLEEDPEKFLRLYGFNFVSQITYGGSILGYFSLTTKTETDQQSLDIEGKASYSGGFFSVGGSAEYTKRMNTTNIGLKVSSGLVAKPSVECSVINTPKDLVDCYEEWNKAALSDAAAPLYLQLSNYAVSQDVQDIISADDWKGDLSDFIDVAISPRTLLKVTQERLNTELLIKTLYMYLVRYKSVQDNIPPGIKETVRVLLSDAEEYESNLFHITDVQLYLLNEQLVNNLQNNDIISNRFKSWLYYEQTLQKEAELLRISKPIELEGAILVGKRQPGGIWTESLLKGDNKYAAKHAIDGKRETMAHSDTLYKKGKYHPDLNAYLEITFQEAEIHTIEFFGRIDFQNFEADWDNLYVEIMNRGISVWRVDLWDKETPSSPRNTSGREYFPFSSPKTGDTLRIGVNEPIRGVEDRSNFLQVSMVNINGWTIPK